jgi:hypothetical protein
MAGKCPTPLEARFIKDCDTLNTRQLAKKYNKSQTTIKEWRLGLHTEGKLDSWVGKRLGRKKKGKKARAKDASLVQPPEFYNMQSAPTDLGPDVQFDGNYAVATSVDGRVRSLPDLLAACKVDLSVWKVVDDGYKIGTWEVGAKDERKDITITNGVLDGYSKKGGIVVETLFRTEAKLVRIEPIALKPVLRPIEIPSFTRPPLPAFSKSVTGTALLMADPHFCFEWEPPQWKLVPHHDRRALDLALQIAEIVQPDVVDMMGDIMDLPVWQTKFTRYPKFYQTTQPSLFEAHWWLRQFVEAVPKAEHRIHGGNHDIRMDKTTTAHMQEAYGLRPVDQFDLPPAMSVQRLLALHQLGIEWIGDYPDDQVWLGEAMQTQHGHIARGKPLGTVTALLEQSEYNQACGHIHRDEMVSKSVRTLDGVMKTITAYCPGCLCHIDGRVEGSTHRSNWRQGVGVVEWAGEHVNIQHVPFHNGEAVFQGEVLKARDVLPDLKKDIPDWNW